jgi:hypothetical protein
MYSMYVGIAVFGYLIAIRPRVKYEILVGRWATVYNYVAPNSDQLLHYCTPYVVRECRGQT